MEKKFLNLVANFGFGVGKSYYEQLPQIAKMVYAGKNWINLSKKMSSLLKVHIQVLNQNNIPIHVEQHVQAAFEMVFKLQDTPTLS